MIQKEHMIALPIPLDKSRKKKKTDLYIIEVGVLANKEAFPMMQSDKDWPTCSLASHC